MKRADRGDPLFDWKYCLIDSSRPPLGEVRNDRFPIIGDRQLFWFTAG